MNSFDKSEFEANKIEVKEKFGETSAYNEHVEKTKDYSQDKWNSLAVGMDDIMGNFT